MHRSNHMHHFFGHFRSYRFSIVDVPQDCLDFSERSNRSRSTFSFSTQLHSPRHGRAAEFDPRPWTSFYRKNNNALTDEHGQNAAKRGKHLQACPFDTGTMEWRQWREGFLSVRAQSNPWSMPHSATHFV